MRNGSRRAFLAGAASIAAQPARAEPVRLRLGTATPGGGFPVYGAALVEGLRRADPGLAIEAISTLGSIENVPRLEDGTLDLALVQGEVVHEALSGIGRPPARLDIVTAMYATAGLFVVRADSPARTIADLRGKPIAWGARGSGLVILGRYAMDGLGLDAARDFDPVYLERAADGPAMVLDGRVAALWGGGAGWPGFMTVARSRPGARFIAPDRDGIRRILDRHPFLRPVAQPAGSFPGQEAPIDSVGSWSFVLSRPDLDPGTGHRIARALHRLEAMAPPEQLAETTARNTAALAPRERLQPGVARYLREAGLLPP